MVTDQYDDNDDDEDDDGDDDDDNDSCLHQTACRVIAPKSQRAQPTASWLLRTH